MLRRYIRKNYASISYASKQVVAMTVTIYNLNSSVHGINIFDIF